MKTKPEFESLVEEHGREIFAYLWRMLGDYQDAEDSLQDTFMRAYRAYPRLADDSHIRAWLYKIATNVARTQIKRRNKLNTSTTDIDPQSVADHRSNDGRLDARLSLAAVQAVVEKLPYKQRTALMMRKYQGLEYAEIALVLKSSEDAARANVYQALKKLRKQLADQI